MTAVLLGNGAVDLWFFYGAAKGALLRVQQEKAEAAAHQIVQFVAEIERQIGWTTHAQWAAGSLDQRRFDFVRLLRQVPAIAELVQLDGQGREQLRLSRSAKVLLDSPVDYSKNLKLAEAREKGIWFSAVHFRDESQPYLTVAMAHAGQDAGVTIAEVNLKLISDVVSAMSVGIAAYSYVTDSEGRLIAHPNISVFEDLVLPNSDLSILPQVAAAKSGADAASTTALARDLAGRAVLTAYAPIATQGWLVFVELPRSEAFAPLYASILRSAAFLAAGLVIATLAGFLLARRMVVPIEALRAGAAEIGGGDLGRRIIVETGDEIQALADQFNDMAGRLQQSYADLEGKIEARTRELKRSVDELKALGEVGQAVNSTLDLETVLTTIVARAVELSATDAGAIYVRDTGDGELRLRAAYGMGEELVKALSDAASEGQQTLVGRAVASREAVEIADISAHPIYPLRELMERAGFKALLAVPLLRDNEAVGALVVRRKTPGTFERNIVESLQTMGTQSALAIYNARLFGEIEEKGRQLEIASQHKSRFLANMSHELRTPLNAILGYTELVLDNIYGDTPEKVRQVLERVQSNGRHLLGLINDVLDLSKIEAGQLTLSLADYSLKEVVQRALASVEALAAEKQLSVKLDLPADLPPGRGDERRITQVLLNLLGNAIKFTDSGEVGVSVSASNDMFILAVRDTGPGIAEADQRRIFEEFQQADNSETRKKGGTGLGLAIARRIVEMHGGRMWVESSPGLGSTFSFSLPVTVERQEEAA